MNGAHGRRPSRSACGACGNLITISLSGCRLWVASKAFFFCSHGFPCKMLQGKGFWPKPFASARDPLKPLYVGSVQPPCRSPGGWLKCPPKGDPREMHQALSPVGLTPSVGMNSSEDNNCGVNGCFRSAEHFTQLELKECSPQCPEEAVQFFPVSR